MLHQHHELVAAHARDHVDLVHAAADALAEDPQGLIAGGVAEAVVDPLEVIEIECEQCQRHLIPARSRQRALQALLELAAVGQASQAIGACQCLQRLLCLHAFADIAAGVDDIKADAVLGRHAFGQGLDPHPVPLAVTNPELHPRGAAVGEQGGQALRQLGAVVRVHQLPARLHQFLRAETDQRLRRTRDIATPAIAAEPHHQIARMFSQQPIA